MQGRGVPLCTVCARAARDVVARPAWLHDSLLMRRVLADRNIPAVIAVCRAASGLSQHDLAAILGLGQPTLSCYERGKRRAVYDIDLLMRFVDAVGMPRSALLSLVFSDPDAVLAGDRVLEVLGVDVDRRRFGALAAGTAAAFTLPDTPLPARVTPSHIRYLRAALDNLYTREQTIGGATLLQPALRYWQLASRMLKESSHTDAVRRQLLGVGGDLALGAGGLALDAGDVPLARRLYSAALELAGDAGDAVLTVHALERQSDLASYVARTSQDRAPAREGLQLAYQAVDEARYEPMPRLHALVAIRHAQAASLLGDKAAFRSAITRARRELDRGPRASEPGWMWYVDETGITYTEAQGLWSLGEMAPAEKLYRSVLDSGLEPCRRAYIGTGLIGALLGSGAREDAISEGNTVLSALEGGLTSVKRLAELRPVRVAAGASEKSGAEQFCARFDAIERDLTAA
jgi:transcriptional regulator with XRE-family HTH domain